MNAIEDEGFEFDDQVVYWVEGDNKDTSELEPFDLFAALQSEEPWLIKELLADMSLSDKELEEVKDAVLTQIVILNSSNDEEYLSRFREFKSILNAICTGTSREFLSAEEIRKELRKPALSKTRLLQLKRSISLGSHLR